MSWNPWSRVDEKGLARYVTDRAGNDLDLNIDRVKEELAVHGRERIIQRVYEALAARRIRYALEPYHPSTASQRIRTPSEIFTHREGTCLDLAVLFCGACLRFDLLPVLIVLDGHALAAVYSTHGIHKWNKARPGRALFDAGPLTDPSRLRDLIENEQCLVPIECTGFAHSTFLSADAKGSPETVGRENGMMTFERAVAAGREQLSGARPLLYALDIAVAHYDWEIKPILGGPDAPADSDETSGVAQRDPSVEGDGSDVAVADFADGPIRDDVREAISKADDQDTIQVVAARYFRIQSWAAALRANKKKAAIALKAEDHQRRADAYETMGALYWRVGDRIRARQCWRVCRVVYDEFYRDQQPALEQRIKAIALAAPAKPTPR